MTKKTEFLNRLIQLAVCYDELVLFFKTEKLMTDFELDSLRNDADKGKFIVNTLESLRKSEKLLLLDYEWQILPVERLKLTIVTERVSKEFAFRS